MEGYETLIRKDGSKFYVCDKCDVRGFGCSIEESMIVHVVTHHTDEVNHQMPQNGTIESWIKYGLIKKIGPNKYELLEDMTPKEPGNPHGMFKGDIIDVS